MTSADLSANALLGLSPDTLGLYFGPLQLVLDEYAKYLKAQPESPEGWIQLARLYIHSALLPEAQHALEQPGDEAARLRWMFRTVLGRAPVSRETELLLQSLVQLREDLRAVPDEAAKIVALGEAPPATGLDLLDHAAWSCLCSVLLNSDEALTIH